MEDLHLPYKLRWAGEPMPDLSDFTEPLIIPFWYVDSGGGESEPTHLAPK